MPQKPKDKTNKKHAQPTYRDESETEGIKEFSIRKIDEDELIKTAPSAPVKEIKPDVSSEAVKLASAVKTAERKPHDEWSIHRVGERADLFSDVTCSKILGHLQSLDLITDDQVQQVKTMMQKEGSCVGEMIVKKGILTERELGQAVATYFHCTYVPFKGLQIPSRLISLIPKEVIQKSGIVIFEEQDDFYKVAMVNPEDTHFIHLLEKKLDKPIEIHFTLSNQIDEALKSYPSEFADKLDVLMARASDNIFHLDTLTNISDVFDSLALLAYKRGASDIHIEPFETEIRVRFRIDGVLSTITTLPFKFLETIINHIKVLTKLRIDTHNAFQDGRFHVTYEKATINFRVSIMPSHYGEKAVLRLLTSETQEWNLDELGYREEDRLVIEKNIRKTNGMILCCGPTGSGKTTTLYALLKELNQEGVNISTIEDPIEYGLPGILQTQVNARTNITYAEGLKSLMRQDPDILMIGEVRDFETGNIAVNASLTGHLVLSTLHTNNASLAPLRLLQMGVDPYLITTTVNLIIAQRLVRRVCENCRISYSLSVAELDELTNRFTLDTEQKELFKQYFNGRSRLFKGQGCDKCGDTGFYGRAVVAEVLEMKDNIQELIMNHKSEADIQDTAQKNGMTTMFEDGLSKIKEGKTTLEEVFRVINQ